MIEKTSPEKSINNSEKLIYSKSLQKQGNNTPFEVSITAHFKDAVEYDIKPVHWLFTGFLALSKLHILAGRPGTGKTTIAMKFAASTTTGTGWPDESNSEPGRVVIWSGEDSPDDTLIPRLIQADADIKLISFVHSVTDATCGRREFDPATDMAALYRGIVRIGDVKLLIIDPIVSAVMGDDHKNAIVRRSLQPIADLATASGIAVLGISHFTKGSSSHGKYPVDRVMGSAAYGAAARIVLIASKDENGGHVFCRAKSNIGADDGGYEYNLIQRPLTDHQEIIASYVQWGDAISGNATDILAEAEGTDSGDGKLNEAKEFLVSILANGQAVTASEVKERAAEIGISERTLRRARKALQIHVAYKGFSKDRRSYWTLSAP